MWISKDVVRWHKGHYRKMMQAICSECGQSGHVGGYLSLEHLAPHNCK